MKRLVSAFLPLFFVFNAIAQSGNEWIQYQQTYFKIPVGQDGLYRVSFEALRLAGFPSAADPKTIQIFHRGNEQAIIVQGESDGSFDNSDYIEFYGRKNDGTLDATLYEDPHHQPHKYYNLYSDTAAYFLTYGSSNGKRISTFAGLPATATLQSFHQAEKLLVLSDSYSAGIDYGNVHKTTFDAGEGWMGAQVLHGQEIVYTLEGINATAAASGKPTLEVLLTGRGPMFHSVDLYAGNRLVSNLRFDGYESFKHTQEIEWTDIDATGRLMVKIRLPGSDGPDRVSAGYVRLLFPQQLTMNSATGKIFRFDTSTPGDLLLKIQDSPPSTRLFDITDPSTPVHINTELSSTLDAVVAAPAGQRIILATSQPLMPQRIRRISFRDIHPASHNYVIITHRSLRKAAGGYTDPVKAYAEYRSFPEGGGFDTLVVDVDQLYDQFNYGEASPRAIFQFMKFLAGVRLPEYLFLIGKGLDVNYGYRRNPSAFTFYKDLVPTAGYPASDMAFTAGLGGAPYVHVVATGRLTANTPAEVAGYLNKVKERDILPYNDLNRKKILHLSGGIEENEPVLFRDILRDFEAVAENFYLGGQVQAIAKQSTDIKLVNIAEEVNQGLGLVTFFGHSAPNTLDFDIGLVTDPVMGYNNSGKYPLMLMNGCDAGSFFLNTTIIGENWIHTPSKGAIGYIAHSAYGLVTGLQRYSSTFYDVAFRDSVFITKGVGRVQQEVSRRYIANFGATPLGVSQIQQMVLLGDPAVKIFGATKPDYSPDREHVTFQSFNEEPITALSDSILLRIPVRNFGVARDKNFRINVTRRWGGDQVLQYDTIIPAVLFADTINMVIRNPNNSGSGINTFVIHADADDFIEEINEANNIATVEYFIPLNSTRNLFPYNYSIVRDRQVNLSFQYTDLLSGSREYVLEVDTTNTFDSGFKKEFRITADVLARQQVTLLNEDSLVYYWRTKIAQPLENESKTWTLSSFTYIEDGPEGWAQIEFAQYAANHTAGLVKDPLLRRIQFQETVSDVAVKTFSASSGRPQDSVSLKINGVEFNLLYEGGACRTNTINLIAFDRRSTQPYAGIYFKWYELLYDYGGRKLLCGREPYVINSFTPQELVTGNGDDMITYIDNIASGDSVVLFSMGDAGYGQWPSAAKAKLAEFGISTEQLDGLQNGDALVIFGRKGSPTGSAHVYHASSGQLKINKTIAGRFNKGAMASGIIGPAQRWDRFIPRVAEVESVDEYGFTLVGIRPDGSEDTLKTQVTTATDLSGFDADTYPQMKVLFETSDDINLTAVQLARWLVLYEPVAEGLVFYRGPLTTQIAYEGETVRRDFGFINISDKIFPDSLTVRVDLRNAGSSQTDREEVKIMGPSPGDSTLFSIALHTVSKGGMNDLEVFVNPRITPEKTFDNNLILMPRHLEVLSDESDPVVEVTFDGRSLRNNEYVSANPLIQVRIWDENRFLLKKDTSGVKILLASPCATDDCGFQSIYLGREDVTWFAATDTSDFKIHFQPKNLASGQYILRVEGRDQTGNSAGATPYEIRFRVEHEESIRVTAAYPNPSSLDTSWEIVITAEEEGQYHYKLNISSLDGRAVAVVSDHASGLHIGTNTVRWDGLGKDGEMLPGGMYFYRLAVVAGQEKKEYKGKIILVR